MNRTCAVVFLAGALAVSCSVQEQTGDARRPIDFFEIARRSDTTEPLTETVTTKFRLLERADVAADMQLTQEQTNSVRKLYEIPSDQIPRLTEFRAEKKAAKQKAGLTEEERQRLNVASARGIGRITARLHDERLRGILQPQQVSRLEQLTLQARGPVMLVVDTNLASVLKLTHDQMEQMRAILRQVDESLR